MPDHSSDAAEEVLGHPAARAEVEDGLASDDPAHRRPADTSSAVDPFDIPAPPPSVAASADDAGASVAGTTSTPRRRRRPRTDWREGGRTVLRWRQGLLAWALLSLGAALVVAALLQAGTGAALAQARTGVVWVGMLVPVVVGLSRSRPAGLLRLRPVDLLYGMVLGLLLRIVQGWLEVGTGGAGAFPTFVRIDGRLSATWWLSDLLGPVVVAPVIEELFFRAVVLVALYTASRRALGRRPAAVVAAIGSTVLFMLVHGVNGALTIDGVISATLLGLVASTLVLTTGRVWGAVLVHLAFNASYVALALVGAFVG